MKLPVQKNIVKIFRQVLVFTLLLLLFSACTKGYSRFQMGNSEEISGIFDNVDTLNLFSVDSVQSFYSKRSNEPIWSNNKFRDEFMDQLELAEDEGLYFEDYHGEKFQDMLNNKEELTEKDLSQLDILLTDAYFKFADHLLYGKVDPKELHGIFDIPRKNRSKSDLLQKAIEEKDIRIAFDKLRPTHPVYNQLIAASREYKELKADTAHFKKIPTGEKIEPGAEDDRIPEIRSRLQELGYLKSGDQQDKEYSEEVQEAIKDFQEENGLLLDGIIGNGTIGNLNQGNQMKHEKILVNLERWRWYPRDLGSHYIIINIADYQLHVVKENDTIRTHKTMVGTGARKTPLFSEEIEHLVFNPTWYIPPTIQNQDVVPGAKGNPDYLKNKNIQVLNSDGEKLDASKIDWSSEEVNEYRYQQNPGSTNPLGRVKIMYPNKYLIYLHDTPSQSRFEDNIRAASSGCVRVENAIDLAKYLLNDQEQISSEDIDKILEKGETKQIDVEQPVKVHHFYWTVWQENGKTIFTKDIYNYDNKTYEALEKAS